MLITENELDNWVRGHGEVAQGVIVELVYRLIAASCPRPSRLRFPLGDSIGQPGEDGFLVTDLGFTPFIPAGTSYWEIGTGLKPGTKATQDYRKLTRDTPVGDRTNSQIVFVTPLSGTRGWQRPAQKRWLRQRSKRREWSDISVIDGTILIAWMGHFPAVARWLAGKMGFIKASRIETPEQRWSDLKCIGDPPPLPAALFLTNRDAACSMLKDLVEGRSVWLKIDTHFPRHVADFVSAYFATLGDDLRTEVTGRCLIISDADAWNDAAAMRERHILVADFEVDDADSSGLRLLEKAKRAGHSVVYCGMPGGMPGTNRVALPTPKQYQVEKALEEGGYTEERARNLAQKAGGDLNSLLRCIQGLSLRPEWAQRTDAGELAIAALLGAWDERSEADRAVVEFLSGKPYGEWIGTMRSLVLLPGTPLRFRDGVWKFVARFEGWYALGPFLFDDHLERLQTAVSRVLREKDPQFELPIDERYMASIRGKALAHSRQLRSSIADSLSLLGSHPGALTSCTLGKAEAAAILSVRAILTNADWVQWAGVSNLLPFLAEAAPSEFLNAVEDALNRDPCPYDAIFAQEGDGITGGNYMTGLLWALETLAWDSEYLSRVIFCLGQLAARDPGGRWANRPGNSITTILLPWLPQTCAPVSTRGTAVASLLKELPDIGWKILLGLLPQFHSASSGSRKPAWRETIPDNWSKGVTNREYWEQVTLYAELTINAAKNDIAKLSDLVERLEDLPPPALEQLLAHIGSDSIMGMPEADRLMLWMKLLQFVTKHRKFSDARWAMGSEQVDVIAALADRLAPRSPQLRYQRLFSDREFDLYEEKGNYGDQRKELEDRRQRAVEEVAASGGIQAVLDFAVTVQSPWRVGIAYGIVAGPDADRTIVPTLLDVEQKSLAQFAGGFVWGRFSSRGWPWVDDINTDQWKHEQIGHFLAYLPFVPETWKQSACRLAGDESPYWSKTSANPYETNVGLEFAVDQLLKTGRPHAAIGCFHKMLHDKQPLDAARAVRALLAAIQSSESSHAMDVYHVVELIKALQDNPDTNSNDLFRIEWAYLPVLNRHQNASPKLLEHRLANEPGFFCEVLRLVFRSKKKKTPEEEPSEQAQRIANNAYRLLSDWRFPPGCRDDGSFEGSTLVDWLKAVKKECAETGHMEVAMTMVGKALIHSPPDPDGLWIHRSAAESLNAKDASDMRDGFRTALFNSRGVHTFTAGREERELAAKYRAQAQAVDTVGFRRLATTLRELATSYDRDAERESSRDPFDD